MLNNSAMPSLADIAAVTNNDSFGGSNSGWWILIILFFIMFGGGWGYNRANAAENVAEGYTLASDFATLQRQIDSSTTSTQTLINNSADQLQRQVTSIGNGISSLGYDQLNQINGVNNNIFASTNQLSSQLSNCCCNMRYEGLQNANTTQNMIQNGFCNTNFNLQNATRDINDTTNAGIQAILSKLCDQEMNAKQAQIDALTQQVNALNLAASQQAQNAYLLTQLKGSNCCGCNC